MPTDQDLSRLAEECALRLEFHEPGFSVREIIPPATMLYDPMLGWVEDDESLVFCDIGGQREPGWNPREGHGSIWRLHRDDRLESIVPAGAIGTGMIMFPMKAPASFGCHGGETFFLGQLKPGREGAHGTHAVYWLPPGWEIPEVFCVVPHAGSISGGISGALCPAGWGEEGTDMEGVLFVVSLMNCTIYMVTPDRRIRPWLICDRENVGVQFMPRKVFQARDSWGDLAGELVVSGHPETSFETPASAGKKVSLEYWRVDDPKGSPRLTRIDRLDADRSALISETGLNASIAPDGFGPFSGQLFACRPGSANLASASRIEGALPYDADIVRFDSSGRIHLFASRLQSGAPDLAFQGNRMVISTVRKSYSTGEYHLPDGSLYEIVYTGGSPSRTPGERQSIR
ncbi:MAG TPA: hypothetical protein ENI85_17315 [Deltaproteobacteria bacterium]|nr:hypothetical protein [Deltaproteobacteria bacterium]